MKGIICEQVHSFTFQENLPEPIRKEGEAIIRIRRVGICGTDYHAFQGNQPFFSYPRILGHELSGIIEEISDHEAGLRLGDQVSIMPYIHCGQCIACRTGKTNCCTSMKVLGVHIDGGMRERIAVPVSHLFKTNGLSLDQSAVIEPLAIGAHAVSRAQIKPGESVLVIGAGPIGLGVMAFAKVAGARVIAMDISAERLAFSQSWAHIDDVVQPSSQSPEIIAQLTHGDMPTIVFDATGNVNSMNQSFGFVAHGGKLVFVGLVKADITFHDPEFHKRELTVMASRNATKKDFLQVVEVLQAKSIDVERFLTHRCQFPHMIDQFQTWLKPESKVIKAIVEW